MDRDASSLLARNRSPRIVLWHRRHRSLARRGVAEVVVVHNLALAVTATIAALWFASGLFAGVSLTVVVAWFLRSRQKDQKSDRTSSQEAVLNEKTTSRAPDGVQQTGGKRRNQEEAVAAMEHVLGVIGHELRTPLMGLRVMSEYLLAETVEANRDPCSGRADTVAALVPQSSGFLQSIHDEVIRLSQMVNNLLEAARINSGRARWHWTTWSLTDTCRDAIRLIAPLIDQEKVTFREQLGTDDLVMSGDRDAIHRLVLNLLDNARRHTTEGSIEIIVRRSTESANRAPGAEGDSRRLEIIVRDTGNGISRDVIEKLGIPFTLSSGTIGDCDGESSEIVGSGLGIAICNGIAAAHGGGVAIESEVGQGTTATVQLCADLPEPASSPAQTPPVMCSSSPR